MSTSTAKPLWSMTITEASARILKRDLSPVDLIEAFLDRIAAVDDKVHTYIHVAAERARAEARQAADAIASGRWRGPLHGLPFGVKDNYDAAGMPATGGSKLRLKHVPEQDAELVRRLREAGAILLGKLAT